MPKNVKMFFDEKESLDNLILRYRSELFEEDKND